MIWPIVAFTGPAGCGKSTAAKALPDVHRYSFAGPLKAMLEVVGVPHDCLYDQGKKERPLDLLGGKTPRKVLQMLGTDFFRKQIREDFWIRVAEARLTELLTAGPVLVDDCRFDNEAALIRRLGGAVIQIERPGIAHGTHASEQGIDPRLVDRVVRNEGTEEQFIEKVRLVCVR